MTTNKTRSRSVGFRKPVKVAETGEIFESRAAAARAMGCSACLVYQALKFGTPIEGFHLLDYSAEHDDA